MPRKTLTTIWDELQSLYRSCPERSLDADVAHFLQHGYVFSGPTYILMGSRIGTGWHIHCAIGKECLKKFGTLMPYYLPFIGWAREAKGRSEIIWHNTETIFRRLNMQFTNEQLFEKCRYSAANIVAQYREQAPSQYDPVAFGGTPSPPKPPAPPTKDDAAKSLLSQGKRKVASGFSSTILTGGLGDSNPASNVKTLLGS
jgi:hypothetical protein